jgi:protein SCO1/2
MPIPAKSPGLILAAIAALAAGIVTAVWLAPASFINESVTNFVTNNEPQNATWLRDPRPLPEFELLSHAGQAFRKENLTGNWNFLFFGFTHCPDVCPTTLATLNKVLLQISESSATRPPGVVFVSVDPVRDSVAKLAAYVPYFNPVFIGLTGRPDEIQNLTGDMGVAVIYSPVEPGPDEETPDAERNHTVDHSTALFLVDPMGRLAGIFGAPHKAETIIDDFLIISGQR